MNKYQVKIGRGQFVLLTTNLIFSKAIGFTTGIFARKVGSDTWISMLIGFTIGSILFIAITKMGSKFPEKTIIQYCEDLLGRWASKIIGILLIAFFIVSYFASANTITLHLEEYMLPETPLILMCVIFTLICTYGVFLGIEVIVRFSFFAIIAVGLLNVSMVIGTIRTYDIRNLLPLLEQGLLENIESSIYLFSDIAIPILITAMLYPLLGDKKNTTTLSLWSMVIATIAVMTWPITELMTLGPNVMTQYVIVCMQQARAAQLSLYLPRYELIMISLFIWSAYVQATLLFYCSLYGIKQVFGIKKEGYLLIFLTVILTIGTYYAGYDHNRFVLLLTYPWPQICAILCVVIILVLAVANKVKRKVK